MLEEAKKKLGNITADLIKIEAGEKLPFEKERFDYMPAFAAFCFILKRKILILCLKILLSLLKADGKIIVLTPTGAGNLLMLTKHFFSIKNKGIYIWYRATKKRAKTWNRDLYLREYAKNNKLKYRKEMVMKSFALLEILEK
jgi:hypothetical protein